jgi:alkylation response protein AidB-like acyl-CoA dehydrogenase
MSTTAKESADGSYFTINGSKMWITNGTVNGTDTGDVFLVYAKTSLHDGTQVLPRGSNLTSFIVEKGMPGFTLGQKIEDKCGMRASMTAELVFTDVKVSCISHPSFNICFFIIYRSTMLPLYYRCQGAISSARLAGLLYA